jgi:hypothetical protein
MTTTLEVVTDAGDSMFESDPATIRSLLAFTDGQMERSGYKAYFDADDARELRRRWDGGQYA